MKFNCSTNALIDALQIATKALPGRTTNQILEGILVETEENEVVLTCSDERIAIVTRLEAYVKEPGRGIIPGKLFSEIVRRLSDEDVEILMNERFSFTIRSAGNRTNISGQDPDLYPALPAVSGEKEVSLPQDMLRDMIQKTEFAIAVEDMREVLTGSLLEMDVTLRFDIDACRKRVTANGGLADLYSQRFTAGRIQGIADTTHGRLNINMLSFDTEGICRAIL